MFRCKNGWGWRSLLSTRSSNLAIAREARAFFVENNQFIIPCFDDLPTFSTSSDCPFNPVPHLRSLKIYRSTDSRLEWLRSQCDLLVQLPSLHTVSVIGGIETVKAAANDGLFVQRWRYITGAELAVSLGPIAECFEGLSQQIGGGLRFSISLYTEAYNYDLNKRKSESISCDFDELKSLTKTLKEKEGPSALSTLDKEGWLGQVDNTS